MSTLYGLIHVSYIRDERDTVANSILLRVTIPPNTQARVIFEPLFIGAECQTLMEDGKVIWSSETTAEGFNKWFNDRTYRIRRICISSFMEMNKLLIHLLACLLNKNKELSSTHSCGINNKQKKNSFFSLLLLSTKSIMK